MVKHSQMIFIFFIIITLIINCGCLDENGNDKKSKKNHVPTINNFSITEGWPTGYQISWNVTDEDKDNLTISLYYSYDNQTTWILINTFELNEGKTWWNFPDTGRREEYVLKILVTDSESTVENISKKFIAYPIIHRYNYFIEIDPESSGWNLLYLPAILLSNNSLSEINDKLDSNNFQVVETIYGPAIEINTSTYLQLSGEISLTKLDSEYIFSHGFSMYNPYPSNISANPIDTNEFPDEFKSYNLKVGNVWLYYNNSKGFGNISIKLKFDHSCIGEINYAIWGKLLIGWQEKEVYEKAIPA